MVQKLYVGNLSYGTTKDRLTSIFSSFGEVISAKIIMDRDTNCSKGFGFVELDNSANADKAIVALSGREVDGRKIRVDYAKERHSRSLN